MYYFEAHNINILYYELCDKLFNGPEYTINPRGLEINELTNVIIELRHSYNRIVTIRERNMKMKYLIGELCFNLAGSSQLNFIEHYSNFWSTISDNGMTVNSDYGCRLFYQKYNYMTQIDYVYNCLVKDQHSRKATAILYNHYDSKDSKDNPCTIYLHFMIRNCKLNLHTYMRSNDIWFGLTYDIPFFTLVQEILLIKLKNIYSTLEIGTYMHSVGSLHLYEKDFSNVKKLLLNKKKYVSLIMPRLNNTDINNWFAKLLYYEKNIRCSREIINRSLITTPFQEWCIKYLYD